MRDLDAARPDVQRRRHDVVGAEPLEREHGSNDVDDGVERADFMQVDLVERRLVYRGLRLTDAAEQFDRTGLTARRKSRPLDQAVDFGQRVMPVGMVMVVMVGVVPAMIVAVLMIVTVMMIVAVIVVMVMMLLLVPHLDVSRPDARPDNSRDLDVVVNTQAAECLSQRLNRQTCVDERRQQHVAGRA